MEISLEAAPYDNVEFGPIQRGKTGTWPGPQSQQTSSSQQQSSSRTLQGQSGGGKMVGTSGHGGLGTTRLTPLEESSSESFAEARDQRMQATVVTQHQAASSSFGTSTSVTPSTASGVSPLLSSSTQQKSAAATSPFPTQSGVSSSATQGSGVVKGSMLTMFPAATTATTTTTTTSSAVKTTSPVNINNKTDSKTAPKVAISVPTYVLTQVGSGGSGGTSKDSTGLRSGDDDVDFKRHDLDPASRGVLESAFTEHNEFYRLNSKVLDEGALLKQDVLDIYRKSGEAFSYEQLLQGMLEDGEMLLLGGCWLHYVHVEFKDETGEKTLRQPYGRGRLCLTSNRVLLLSADVYTDARLEPFGNVQTKGGGYKLEVSKHHGVVFRNLPLSCFQSAELEVHIGTSAQTKIAARKAPCCGLCSCFGIACCSQRWVSTAPMTRSFNERVVRMGVALPPWGQKSTLILHLDPGQSLTTARDFIAQLHQHSASMH